MVQFRDSPYLCTSIPTKSGRVDGSGSGCRYLGTFMNKLRTFGTTLVTQRDKVYKQWKEALDAIHLLDELKAEACTKRSRAQLAARINNAPKRGEEIKKLVDACGEDNRIWCERC